MPRIRLALRHVSCSLAVLAACATLEVDEDDAGRGGSGLDAGHEPPPGVGPSGGAGGASGGAGGIRVGDDAGANGARCDAHPAGECDGDTLRWCDGAGALQTVDCARMSLRCAFNDALMRTACVPPAAVESPPPVGCNIPPEGDCDANGVLYLCEGDQLVVHNCPAMNRDCGWDAAAGRNACLAPPAVDMCGGVPRDGHCVMGRAEACRAGRVVTEDCRAQGSECELIGGRAICVAPLPPDPCEGIPEGGMCTGNTAVYCIDDARTEVDCAVFGWICFSIPQIVTLCSDPNAGQPSPDPPLEGEGEPCEADGVAGVCRRVGQCAGTATPGLCPGPPEVQCCT